MGMLFYCDQENRKEKIDRLNAVDPEKLDFCSRMGLVYFRLCCGEWDELAGDKPDGFDEMKMTYGTAVKPDANTKEFYTEPILDTISDLLGEAMIFNCLCQFGLFTDRDAAVKKYLESFVIPTDREEDASAARAEEERKQANDDRKKNAQKRKAYIQLAISALVAGLAGVLVGHFLRCVFVGG